MPKPRVNQSREGPSAHPTISLALLVQVGAVPGPPGARSIIGHHPGASGSDPPNMSISQTRTTPASGSSSNSVSIRSSAFAHARLLSRNCVASVEPDDDIPRCSGQNDLGQLLPVVLTSINPHRWPACATLTCTNQSRIDTMPMKRPKRSLGSNVSDWPAPRRAASRSCRGSGDPG